MAGSSAERQLSHIHNNLLPTTLYGRGKQQNAVKRLMSVEV